MLLYFIICMTVAVRMLMELAISLVLGKVCSIFACCKYTRFYAEHVCVYVTFYIFNYFLRMSSPSLDY